MGKTDETFTINRFAKIRYNREIAKDYSIHLQKYHGLGLKHPWYNQQLKYLQTLMGETANKTPTGLLLQASAEYNIREW